MGLCGKSGADPVGGQGVRTAPFRFLGTGGRGGGCPGGGWQVKSYSYKKGRGEEKVLAMLKGLAREIFMQMSSAER